MSAISQNPHLRQEPVVLSAAPSRASERAAYLAALVVFAAASSLTIYFHRSMSGGMPMPGRWTMSMMWMVMPGQSWAGAAFVFIAMWLAMMIAMMLPSTLPLLLVYRRAAAFRGETRLGIKTFALGAGYFLIWTLFGVLAFAAGKVITRAAMMSLALSKLVPLAAAAALVLAGIYQLTPWKSSCLKHCRDPLLLVAHHLHGGARGAFRLGLHHGAYCAACCWGLMLIQLVLEKIMARGELVARMIGVAAILGGLALAAVSLPTW
jgi:predicted metal-binding membrane protein